MQSEQLVLSSNVNSLEGNRQSLQIYMHYFYTWHTCYILQPKICNNFKFNFILLTCSQLRKKVNISNFFYLSYWCNPEFKKVFCSFLNSIFTVLNTCIIIITLYTNLIILFMIHHYSQGLNIFYCTTTDANRFVSTPNCYWVELCWDSHTSYTISPPEVNNDKITWLNYIQSHLL